MFKEFNVEFQNVEMIGGADNLLENTKVTKVVMSGDNKMSSLDSTFKNCSELDNIQGELDLNDVSDIDNILEDTELVKRINLKNVNNKNISADNSFPNVEEISIGGDSYNKKAIQNVIASKDWTFDGVYFTDGVGQSIEMKTIESIDTDNIIIEDALEQKTKNIEIEGQTYINLINGKDEVSLVDECVAESVDGNLSEITATAEQEICVEAVEGQTYQNLITNTRHQKTLTDQFSITLTEQGEFDSIARYTEIEEIQGSLWQNPENLSEIKHIGELYVDKDGNLILDEEGNQQYKIEIIASNADKTESYKTKNLLPQPLREINGVVDKLYWDNKEGTYKINKNIFQFDKEHIYNNMVNISPSSFVAEENRWILADYLTNLGYRHTGISQPLTCYCRKNIFSGVTYDGDHLYITWDETNLLANGYTETVESVKQAWMDCVDYVAIIQKEEIIDTGINKKLKSKSYATKTYINTNTVQPSSITITNKRYLKTPMQLLPNTDYNLQMDVAGKIALQPILDCITSKTNLPDTNITLTSNENGITVNLGGASLTIPIAYSERTKKNVTIRTPATLINNNLELSGEGNKVKNVMLFKGQIGQEPNCFDGISSVGEWDEEGQGYKVIVETDNGYKKLWNE